MKATEEDPGSMTTWELGSCFNVHFFQARPASRSPSGLCQGTGTLMGECACLPGSLSGRPGQSYTPHRTKRHWPQTHTDAHGPGLPKPRPVSAFQLRRDRAVFALSANPREVSMDSTDVLPWICHENDAEELQVRQGGPITGCRAMVWDSIRCRRLIALIVAKLTCWHDRFVE